MAADFYASDAVLFHVDASHLTAAFHELMRSDEYLECYILEYDGKTAGYALLCKSYSQEAGGMVLWIDELYVLPAYRSKGIGGAFFDFLFAQKGGQFKRFRLEVEKDNARAAALYQKMGFDFLAYEQMIKDYE
ncbi:MAG: GNAT family N-acetyltransferase [Clostridiales bacterium]|nr:GNAT family N-acetyltransferase [Clostridiales bacterium]